MSWIRKGIKIKGCVLAAPPVIEGAFNYTKVESICKGAEDYDMTLTLVRWMGHMLRKRSLLVTWGDAVGKV